MKCILRMKSLSRLKCTWTRLIIRLLQKIPKEIIVLYAVTFFVMIPFCFNLRYSMVYVPSAKKEWERQRLIMQNTQRLAESRHIISNFDKMLRNPRGRESGPALHSEDADVAITVVTVNRKHKNDTKQQYLTQTVGRLLVLLNNTSTRLKYGIFLCNVDGDPENFDEIKPLQKLFPTFNRFPQGTQPVNDVIKKEKEDYVFCLEETLKLQVQYVLLLEDDGYAHMDLIPVLENKLESIEKMSHHPRTNVAYIKLYHPERLLCYINLERERLPELISLGCVFGTIMAFIFSKFKRKNQFENKLWLFCILYCSLVALLLGRVNLIELRRFSTQLYQVTPAPSCCTVAMLFTRFGGGIVVSRLKEINCKRGYGKDSALDDIRVKEGLRALMIQPNLFKHIGHYSTLRKAMLDPLVV